MIYGENNWGRSKGRKGQQEELVSTEKPGSFSVVAIYLWSGFMAELKKRINIWVT